LPDVSRQSPIQSSRNLRARSTVAMATLVLPAAGTRASTDPSGSTTSLL
jgi:hypothetical protein